MKLPWSFNGNTKYIKKYVAVAEHENSCCQFRNERAIVPVGSGYLANSITLDTGCGSVDCPWLLQASEGQRINLSIYDFGICKYLIRMFVTSHVFSRSYVTIFIEDRRKIIQTFWTNHVFDCKNYTYWAQRHLQTRVRHNQIMILPFLVFNYI